MGIEASELPAPWTVGSVELSFAKPVLMAVINLTPDSFSDGGRLDSLDAIIAHASAAVDAGARILDVGGESTRPGAAPVSLDDELRRVIPVVEKLSTTFPATLLSIDTQKAEVARQALQTGASIVNDVGGLSQREMRKVIAEARAYACIMHMRGSPATMQSATINYENVADDIRSYLQARLEEAKRDGISVERLALDPGIGFGKRLEDNLELTRNVGRFAVAKCPVLYGPSRKRFLGELTGRDVSDRDRATAAVCALAWRAGASIFRVHDVGACVDALAVAAALYPRT